MVAVNGQEWYRSNSHQQSGVMASWSFTSPSGHLLTCTYIHPAFDDRRQTSLGGAAACLGQLSFAGSDVGCSSFQTSNESPVSAGARDLDTPQMVDRGAKNAGAQRLERKTRHSKKLTSYEAISKSFHLSPHQSKCSITMSSGDFQDEEKKGFSIKGALKLAALTLFFGGATAFTRKILQTLPPDFLQRWSKLLADQPEDSIKLLDNPKPTIIYDRHGTVIATIVSGGIGTAKEGGDQDTLLQPIEIPTAMWQAIVAHEDRRFFDHEGVDYRGLSRAIVSLGQSGGGSTITQQVGSALRGLIKQTRIIHLHFKDFNKWCPFPHAFI